MIQSTAARETTARETGPAGIAPMGTVPMGTVVRRNGEGPRIARSAAMTNDLVNPDYVIDRGGFAMELSTFFLPQRAITIEDLSTGDVYGQLWGRTDTVTLEAKLGADLILAGADVTITSNAGGEISLGSLPTSEPANSGVLYTQTAAELGGAGTTPVLCVSTGATPSAPSAPTLCKQANAIIVEWGAIGIADSYDVERAVGGGSFSLWEENVSGTSVADTVPINNPSTTYSYRVRACNFNGCSSYSSSRSTTYDTATSC